MLAGLYGVNRLSRDIEMYCQFRLAPVSHCAQNLEAVFHAGFRNLAP